MDIANGVILHMKDVIQKKRIAHVKTEGSVQGKDVIYLHECI